MQYILKYLHVRNILLENRSMVHILCMTATFTTHEDNSWAWVHEEKATVCKGSYAVSSYICIMTCFCHDVLWDSICVSTWKGFPKAKRQTIVSAIRCVVLIVLWILGEIFPYGGFNFYTIHLTLSPLPQKQAGPGTWKTRAQINLPGHL